MRADTTVVAADVGYPTDSGLLAKAHRGRCARTVARIKAAGGATRTRARDRRRSAGRRARSIAAKLRLRGAQQRDEAQAAVRASPGNWPGSPKRPMRDAASGAPQRQTRAAHVPPGTRKGRLHQAIDHLDTMVGRTQQVVAQTRSRLAGVMPESAHRVVSLHDADARPIRKGRLGKPVEFGYKAQIVDNADGVILDHNVEIGNPADAPQLAPAIERITRRTGRPPRAVTADRGYGVASRRTRPARARRAQRGDPAHESNPAPPAASSNTGEPSATRSNGEPAPKAGSTTSNEATAGTAPNSPASTAPEPGADTASSPTTSSRSAPSRHDQHHHPVGRSRQPPTRLAAITPTNPFSGPSRSYFDLKKSGRGGG